MKDLTRWAVVSADRYLTPSGEVEVYATAITKEKAKEIHRLLEPRHHRHPLLKVVRKDSL